jgi:hypothetical protein
MIMKKVNILFTAFALLFGCNSTEYMDFTDTQIKIENADAQFTAAGGRREFLVNVSGNYTATSDKDWCRATVSGNTITMDVEPNPNISGRTALLTIRSGNRFNYIPVTQTSATITLDNYLYTVYEQEDTIFVKYECDFPVAVLSPPEWIKASVNTGKKEIQFIVEAEDRYPRTATIQIYADGGNNTVLAIREITVRQNFLSYDDFLGPYTMQYFKSTSTTARPFSLNASLIAGVHGKTYLLKGILADDDAGNIVVYYDELSGSLSFTGCKIVPALVSGSPDTWWAPYLRRNTSYYVLPTNAYGMRSTNHNIEGRLKFSLEDEGLASGYTAIGFILRKYIGTSNAGNVTGKDGQSMYLYPTFERK